MESTMDTATHQPGDFIAYPTNRVVGTIADAKSARAAIEALLQAGVERGDIDVLHGEGDLHRLDPSGAEHGFLAQFQRTLIRLAGPIEESSHLRHHVEDVRAGRFVIMVLAKSQERRDVVAGILNAHGAEFMGFYGRWAWTAMSGGTAESDHVSGVDPVRGQSYETELEGVGFRLHFDFRDEVVDATDHSARRNGASRQQAFCDGWGGAAAHRASSRDRDCLLFIWGSFSRAITSCRSSASRRRQ